MSSEILLRIARAATTTVLAVAAQLAPATARAAVLPARVEVEISGSPLFLRAAEDARVAACIQATVCDMARSRWKLFDWQPPADPAPDPAAALRWLVEIKIQPTTVADAAGGTHTSAAVWLRHHLVVDGTRYDLPLTTSQELLYDVATPKPGRDEVDVMLKNLRPLLEAQLDNLLQSAVVAAAMGKVQLGEKVIPDPTRRRVVIPLRLDELEADVNSVLRVTMDGPLITNHAGRLDLKVATPIDDDEVPDQRGFVTGPVMDVVPNEDAVTVPAGWHDWFGQLIDAATTIRIFMLDYRPTLTGTAVTSDGLVLDPGDTGAQPCNS